MATTGILVLMVHDEVSAVGVYPDVESARDAYLEFEHSQGRDEQDFLLDKAEFLSNLEKAKRSLQPRPGGLYIEFPSGFGDWDIRMQTIDVQL